MKHFISRLLPVPLLGKYKEKKATKQYSKWVEAGSPIPPCHAVKKMIIKSYQQKYDYEILIETGTYQGDMIISLYNNFREIHSIELADYYYQKALKRFRKYPKVHLHKGDSSKVMKDVINEINKPVIFWLDGHYSGGLTAKGDSECPIWGELEAILLTNIPHIILIDDARCFDGKGDYPTIDAIKEYLFEKANVDFFEAKDDIIQVVLKIQA